MIVNRQRRVSVDLKPLEEFFERVRKQLRFLPGSVTIRLVSDSEIARLNRTFRHKKGPTDVLSFPAGEEKQVDEGVYAGDIAISPQTARRNARRFGRLLPVEIRILILHGMLHLAGYDHETDNGEMEKIERRLRRRLGVNGR